MRIVYVVSFAPDLTGTGSMGGFEWTHTEQPAIDYLLRVLKDGRRGHDYTLRALPVPSHLDDFEITQYINAHTDWVELPMMKRWLEGIA